MRRDLALVAVFALLMFSIANPILSSIPAARGNEIQEASFLTAADGDESSESLTAFAETLDDDVLFYLDAFEVEKFASYSNWSGDALITGDYTDTLVSDDTYFKVDTGAGGYALVRVTNPTEQIDSVSVLVEGQYYGTAGLTGYAQVYDQDDGDWYTLGTLIRYTDADFTLSSTNDTYWSDGYVYLRLYGVDDIGAWMDYAIVTYEVMHLADSEHYADGFCSVDDWTTSDTSISSDGDLGTITENGAGSSGRAYASFSSTDFFEYYYEFRIDSMTATTANLEFWDGAAYNTLKTFTAAGTYNGVISDTDAATMQRIGFLVGSEGGNIKPDYLRLFPADESGWAHDGSTTAGVTPIGDATVSSDGSTLSIIRGAGGSAAYIYVDTTATVLKVEADDYQFLEVGFSAACAGNNTALYVNDGSTNRLLNIDLTIAATSYRWNIKAALVGGDLERVLIYSNTAGGAVEVEYVKVFSIANWSITQSGAGIDDYLYVSGGALVSTVGSGYIELNHDPALSVSDTYSVYNLTTSGTAPQFSQYVSEWSTYSDDTRGATTSGTVTDIKLKFDSIETISAIKFIEDGTAPTVVRSSSTPNDPSDDESVMLTAVITDAVEVYKVYFDAIVSPDGFSDVPYYATEQTDNLWTYEFPTLTTGPYVFKVVATDGANNNALTEYAYIELTVREAAIQLDPINQEGAEPDATHYQVSFVSNKDGDWSVTEWIQTDGSDAAETHTGVVVEGWNNIAWEKLDTDSSVVYFNMTVTNGTLTKTVPGLYLVAQTTFYVDANTVEGLDTVTVSGRISKLGAWQLYDEADTLKDTGSITDLDFAVRFNKWSGYDEQDHDFAIKFTNGSQSCWYNSSYYAFKKPAVAPPATTDKNALYAYQASFWTGVGVAAILGLILVDLYRRYWK